jgi:transposase InsO family protein
MILKSEPCHAVRWMLIRMKNTGALGPERIDDFLQASAGMDFAGQGRRGVYEWITATLVEQEYFTLRKKQRGNVRDLLRKLSGLSMPQITRLIRRYHTDGELSVRSSLRQRFPVKYTVQDLELLIEVDRAHQQLSGPATRRIIEREWHVFGKRKYANLAEISPSHLYNLRHSVGYRQRAAEFTSTKPSGIAIGERRRPKPQGAPGYVRIDTVHQGDWDGVKGVYHLNAVDEVTQWEVLGCIARINEEHLLPVLEAMLHQFPFRVVELHADNGSEFVNHPLYQLLKKHTVEFTRSRPNRSSDNALVEGKNGAVVRKHLGYGHISAEHADSIQRFYTAHFNPYLNYHRPCGFAQVRYDDRGRRQRHYAAEDYATPYEKLRSLSNGHRYLKDNLRWELLDQRAYAVSDTEAARRMMSAKADLLRRCKWESPEAPRC